MESAAPRGGLAVATAVAIGLLACTPFGAEEAPDGGGAGADASVSDAADAGAPDAAAAGDAGGKRDGGGACNEPNAKKYGGHCYFPIAAGTRDATQRMCVDAGAHLLTLADQAEQDAIFSLVTGDTWIGYTASPPSDDKAAFKWVTGEATGFARWDTSDPNETSGCVILKTNTMWSDRACTDSYPAICERD